MRHCIDFSVATCVGKNKLQQQQFEYQIAQSKNFVQIIDQVICVHLIKLKNDTIEVDQKLR